MTSHVTTMEIPTWHHWRNAFLKAMVLAFFFIFLTLHFADPIRLVTADIGRHLKNGELILAGERDVFTKNYYAYSYPDFPFINHHWGSGVLFYLVYKYAGGFPGLSFFYIGILLLTFYVFFRLAERFSNFPVAFFFSVLAFPIFTDRLEIRPEGISTLLIGIYLYLLFMFRNGRIPFRVMVWLIPLLQIFWVNTHIFFFIGGYMIAAFVVDAWLSRRDWVLTRQLLIIAGLTALVSLINPAGLKGALMPLTILREYGYRLAENQTVFFMQKRFSDIKYFYFEGMAILTLAGLIAGYWKKSWREHVAPVLVILFFAVLGFKTVRSMAMFGFLFIPMSSLLWYGVLKRAPARVQSIVSIVLMIIALAIVLRGIVSTDSYFSPYRRLAPFVSRDPQVQKGKGFGYLLTHPEVWSGLVPGVNDSAKFFNRLNIQGPIFNNYDIGGFLIFHLFPRAKVFVDNRPEVYSVAFFRDIYVPMQERNEVWEQVDSQYHFNAIFFYRHDLTPWGQHFMINRIRDPQWAPVFVDDFTIIFLRRNEQNGALIKAFELPRSMFQINE